jgi:transposase
MPQPSRLCPSAAELRVEHVATEGAVITIHATAHRMTVPCPDCGTPATRVQSRYPRTLADLPWQGDSVRLVVTVRRFYCEAPGCRRRIFAERLPETAVPYARRTRRAASALEAIGFAAGGRPGARLALALGLAGTANTVLAQVRRAPAPTAATPRVLGVDDWSLRRGLRYGTILVDLERHRVVDLLPDREAATFAAWLIAHPGVAIISRDRGGAYAEGGRRGAPDAIQVADRFHLVKNLVDALERACTRQHRALRAAAEACGIASVPTAQGIRGRRSGLPVRSAGATADARRGAERRAKRLARYEQVVALRDAGHSRQRIAQELGLTRGTVARNRARSRRTA